MPEPSTTGFLAGVIEGFYGPPWAPGERLELFGQMAEWGLDTYFYCPKDDWKQRAIWRDDYSPTEAETLRETIQACDSRGLRFLYALSPGLDIRYSRPSELQHLRRRFEQMIGLGARHFALLFDDIPDRLDPSDLEHWGSLASAQAHIANTLFAWTRQRLPQSRFLFCPTPYCGRMAAAKLGGKDYLADLGAHLHADIGVLWTGPEIISREISVDHIRDVAATLRRKPILWDNLHANDYDGRRFFCGPYSGRSRELLPEVSGILANPNSEFPLNFVPLRTLALFVRGQGPWNPRAAYLEALREWHTRFTTCGHPITFQDLLLLCDCFYLPHEDGEQAARLFALARDLLGTPPDQWGPRTEPFQALAKRLRDTCARLPELHHRPLFHALGRRIWELREEMDLLDRYVGLRSAHPDPAYRIESDFHLPGTYRGGFVARLQQLLHQTPTGDFVPSPSTSASAPASTFTPTPTPASS